MENLENSLSSTLDFFNTTHCIISIDYEPDIDNYIVYVLDSSNHWFYLTKRKKLNLAVTFAYRFYNCHPNYSGLVINYLKT